MTESGEGSRGTLVYRGHFEGRECAIKALIKGQWRKVTMEIDNLLRIEKDMIHPGNTVYVQQVKG